jgi:hypothetical protein
MHLAARACTLAQIAWRSFIPRVFLPDYGVIRHQSALAVGGSARYRDSDQVEIEVASPFPCASRFSRDGMFSY